jgi:hypothetical protein
MFADVVIGMSLLIGVVHSLETSIRYVLLIFSPGNFLGIKKICDRRNVGGYLVVVVIVHSERVTTSGSAVVGFRRMGDGIVVGPKAY